MMPNHAEHRIYRVSTVFCGEHDDRSDRDACASILQSVKTNFFNFDNMLSPFCSRSVGAIYLNGSTQFTVYGLTCSYALPKTDLR